MLFEIKKVIKKGDYLYVFVPDHPNATKNGYVLIHSMDSKEHNRMHSSTGRTIVELVCPCCGKTFSRELRAVHGGMSFCSRSCNGKYQRAHNWTGH